MKTKEQIVELVIKAMPYPEQITSWSFTESNDSVLFTWRGQRFKVNNNLFVVEIEKDCGVGSNTAILLERLIKMYNNNEETK